MLKEMFDRLVSLVTWVIMVAPWEQALRIRLGKYSRLLGPGIHLRIPCIDRMYVQPVRRRICVLPSQTLTTVDDKTVSLSAGLGYTIIDLQVLYSTLHEPQDTIEIEAAAEIGDYVAEHTLAECVPSRLGPVITKRLKLRKYGLGRVEVRICSFAVVRTYRLITGGFKEWQQETIDTTIEE